jgi:transposase
MQVLTETEWAALAPLVEECRPKGKTAPRHLRRTIEAAIIWRHRNGATWRALPAELGPWWRAAQTFSSAGPSWASGSAWERLLARAQERGVSLGMVFLDGTTIRAHAKAAGAAKKGAGAAPAATRARRSAARAAATAPRRA